MVEAVNRMPPAPLIQRVAASVRDPAPVYRRTQSENDAQTDPAREVLRRARRAEMETLLAAMASAPPDAHAAAAHLLREAARKLVRLKDEARAAAASGDRKAARAIARDLAVLARQIADAAQDYAVAQAQPDVVSPALAKAATRMQVAVPAKAGDAIDAGAVVGAATAAAAEAAQVAAETGTPETAVSETKTADSASHPVQRPVEQETAPVSASPSGSIGAPDEAIPVKAHRLFEETMDLLRAMEDVISRRRTWIGRFGLAGPGARPVWPSGSTSASASTAQPVIGSPRVAAPQRR